MLLCRDSSFVFLFLFFKNLSFCLAWGANKYHTFQNNTNNNCWILANLRKDAKNVSNKKIKQKGQQLSDEPK